MSTALSIPTGAITRLDQQITAHIQRHLANDRPAIATAIRQIAAETAVALAERTFPSTMAIGYAVRSVRADVSAVYCTPGRIYQTLSEKNIHLAGAFWAAIKKNDLAAAARIVRDSGTPVATTRIGGPLDPALHEKSRDTKGRVTLRAPLQMTTREEIAAYTRTVIASLGKTASGWSAAADNLGAPVPTRWKSVAVHGRQGGHTRTTITPKTITITLINTRPLARKHISPGQVHAIRTAAAEKITRALQK